MLLMGSILLSCAHISEWGSPSAGAFEIPSKAVFGWRLVPGQEFSYAHTVRLVRGVEETSRTERWTYLVREVSPDGVALLEARVSGLGVFLSREEGVVSKWELEALEDEEKERLGALTAWISLTQDGQLQSVDGLTWTDAVVHRALALGFPRQPLSAGDSWEDPNSISSFVELLPPEVAILPRAESSLHSLGQGVDTVTAEILTEGEIVAGGEEVPRLTLEGRGVWDLARGVLLSRTLTVSLSQYGDRFGGLLVLETERQP